MSWRMVLDLVRRDNSKNCQGWVRVELVALNPGFDAQHYIKREVVLYACNPKM